MKLSKFKCLLGELAMTVQQSQLDELRAVANLSAREQGEAQSCIKLLQFLRRKQPTDMALVDELLGLFKEIPSMTNLCRIVKQFKDENPHLDVEQTSNNRTYSLSPCSQEQSETFRKMLLAVSQNIKWPHLEIMVALSPTPEGNKERIREGYHLFDEMKTHGYISEKDTELLESFFELLKLNGPMESLLQYKQKFIPMTTNQYEPSAPPPPGPLPALSQPYAYGRSYSGPTSVSPESLSAPVSSVPFTNSSSQPSYGYSCMQYSVPPPQRHRDTFHDPLSHRSGDGFTSGSPEHAQLTPSSEATSISTPVEEERQEKQPMRDPGGFQPTVDEGTPNSTVHPFRGIIGSNSSMSSLQSMTRRVNPVNVASQDEGVTTYPQLNRSPQNTPTSFSQQSSTHPPATPVSQTQHHVSNPTASSTRTHSAPMPGSNHTSPTSITPTRAGGLQRKNESSFDEMLPPQKRPRTGESMAASVHQPISQGTVLQGNVHSLGAPSSGIDTNTGWSTTSSSNTYSASGVENQFLTPYSEQGLQHQPTAPGQPLSDLSSTASFSAHVSFPNPHEEENGPVRLQHQNPSRLPVPPVNSSPSQPYISPRAVQSPPNVLPTTRANQLSTATPSMRSASTTARSVPQSRPPQRTERGQIVASPESDDRNVDLQNPTGEVSHRAEAYSTMSSYGQPSLAPTESSIASYRAESLNLPQPIERHHTGEVPTFVPGIGATRAASHEQESSNMAAAGIRGVSSRLYPVLTPEGTTPTGNDEPLSEGSSFTTVSSNLTEESSPSTMTSTRKRPRTRSQKDKEDEQSITSTSKRQKTTTPVKGKTKEPSKNINSAKQPEKAKVKMEKPSLKLKFFSYLWPFGGSKGSETEENEQQQSDPEHSTETEEAQTSDGEYESAKEEEPNTK